LCELYTSYVPSSRFANTAAACESLGAYVASVLLFASSDLESTLGDKSLVADHFNVVMYNAKTVNKDGTMSCMRVDRTVRL